jgi:hypothetical protein
MNQGVSVPGDTLDLETIAELLDGRLRGYARAVTIQRLAADARAYQTFAESVATIDDMLETPFDRIVNSPLI